jgi:AbrB family looped-hinge helix DNA binding protein
MYDTTNIDGSAMPTVTVSPKFQVVIPREVRQELGLIPGQKLHVIVQGDRIELIRARTARELRGAFKNLDSRVERDGDRV